MPGDLPRGPLASPLPYGAGGRIPYGLLTDDETDVWNH